MNYRKVKLRVIADTLRISPECVNYIIHEFLVKNKISEIDGKIDELGYEPLLHPTSVIQT